MGDDGLQIYHVSGSAVNRVTDINWDDPEFMAQAQKAVIKDCKRSAVVILNDMVEQHYRKERLPNVSFFDRAGLIKRRLGIAFPNFRVRAALKLKDKSAPAAGDSIGSPYLFAAIPASDFFNKTIEVVRLTGVTLDGVYLLPVESSKMVAQLSKKINQNSKDKPIWTIFVGQHHNGNLRQIVTRKGELALTRLTPIVDTDVEPQLWAKEVADEINATMSYLARFGYKPIDGLDIAVTSNGESTNALQKLLNIDANLVFMNAQEIARLLGQKIGKQEDLRYADPIHVGYLASRKSYTLPLESAAINQIVKPRKVASVVILAMMAAIAYFGFTLFTNWTNYKDLDNQLVVATQQTQSLKEEYRIELERQKEMGFDFLLVDNAIQIHEKLVSQKMRPLPIVNEIGRSLDVDIKLDSLEFQIVEVEANRSDIVYDDMGNEIEPENQKFLEALLTISFPSTVNPDISVRKVNELRDKLAGSLMGYEVRIVKQVADLSYTGNFTGGAGAIQGQNQPDQYDAEIEIRGVLK